ncbi:hypothetical protein SNEBB_009960 [Seison nebaliae]|nr:hypothetical protein SNEBB_009960 [Seison nebaliae]
MMATDKISKMFDDFCSKNFQQVNRHDQKTKSSKCQRSSSMKSSGNPVRSYCKPTVSSSAKRKSPERRTKRAMSMRQSSITSISINNKEEQNSDIKKKGAMVSQRHLSKSKLPENQSGLPNKNDTHIFHQRPPKIPVIFSKFMNRNKSKKMDMNETDKENNKLKEKKVSNDKLMDKSMKRINSRKSSCDSEKVINETLKDLSSYSHTHRTSCSSENKNEYLINQPNNNLNKSNFSENSVETIQADNNFIKTELNQKNLTDSLRTEQPVETQQKSNEHQDKHRNHQHDGKKKMKFTLDDFETGQVLGRGNFARVLLAKCKLNNQLYALKVLPKDRIKTPEMLQRIQREIRTQMKLKHPNIIRMLTSFDNANYLFLVLSYAPNGQLYDLIKSLTTLPVQYISIYTRNIGDALLHCHSKGVIHRDLKPENILLGRHGEALLADFGSITYLEYERRNTFVGTIDYLAPEVIRGEEQTTTVDCWCLGVLMYEMSVGRPPFWNKFCQATMDLVQNVRYEIPSTVDADAADIIRQLLIKNPSNRMSLEDILDHNFLRRFFHCKPDMEFVKTSLKNLSNNKS